MKTLACLMLSVLLTMSCVAQTGSRSDVDKDLVKHVSKIIVKCQEIKPGMSRGDLQKDFTTEGGTFSLTRRNYVYRRCPYIKLDVEFAKADASRSFLDERATDRIVNVSRPYLEWAVGD